MKPQPGREPPGSAGADEPAFTRDGGRKARPPDLRKNALLLVSDDTDFHKQLRSVANTAGRWVVRVHGAAGALASLQALHPAAVLLDLDAPEHAAWETAEMLLEQPHCPPVLLLTSRSEQFDGSTALRAGSLVDKTEAPSHVLAVVDEVLQQDTPNQAERNAIQRVLIRWLKPCRWPVPITPAYRFWGINE